MKSVIFWILFGAVVCSAEVIENNVCNTGRDSNTISESNEISVDPCPEAAEGEPCLLHRGSNATITIKFTPTLEGNERLNRLKSTIAWVRTDGTEPTFPGMKPNACKYYMDCPVKSAEENTFQSTLYLGSELPNGMYPLKVKVQEQRGKKRVLACQLLTIRLTDPAEEADEE